jgi:hypothetical protein
MRMSRVKEVIALFRNHDRRHREDRRVSGRSPCGADNGQDVWSRVLSPIGWEISDGNGLDVESRGDVGGNRNEVLGK